MAHVWLPLYSKGVARTALQVVPRPRQQTHGILTMSTLYYVTPNLIRKDPELVLAIMQFECTHLLAISILGKRLNRKERHKHQSVWVQSYLKQHATHEHYDNLINELALTNKNI